MVETALTRAAATIQSMAVSMAQVMGMHPEVCLRYRPGGIWECTQAAPEVWFGEPFLASRLDTPWRRSGDCVKLTASNGSWIWKLTADTTIGTNIDGPFTMRRAVWPD